jgi:uncharacterized protein with HEPN domain
MRPEADDDALVFDMIRFGRNAAAAVSGRTFEGFAADEILRFAVERLVEIVGEAARNVSAEFEAEHPEIPWQLVRAQRHVLTHDYGDIFPKRSGALRPSICRR